MAATLAMHTGSTRDGGAALAWLEAGGDPAALAGLTPVTRAWFEAARASLPDLSEEERAGLRVAALEHDVFQGLTRRVFDGG